MKKKILSGLLAAVVAAVLTAGFTDVKISEAGTEENAKEILQMEKTTPDSESEGITVFSVCPFPTKKTEIQILEESVPFEYTVEEFDEVKYANTASNIRKGPSTDYEIVSRAGLNEELQITGRANTGWFRVKKGDLEGFISFKLVSNEPVAVPEEPAIEEPASAEPTPEEPVPTELTPEEVTDPYEGMESHLWDYTEEEIIDYIVSTYTSPDMSPFDKAIALNNYLCNTMEYDYSHTHRSTYDAIAYGIGVCQGYANAYKKLMCAAGVETDYVAGIGFTGSGSGSHGWNRSLIDDVYYYTDVTWNDGLRDNIYLLISYEEISRDHLEQRINPNRIE